MYNISPVSALLACAALAGGCVEPISFTPTPPTVPALRLPMNNAYLGSIHSSDLRPKFVWEPSTAKSDGDIRYELQLSTNRDFEGEKIEKTVFETEYQPDMALPVSFVPPVGARYFWHVRACLGTACSDYSHFWYANVGRVLNDFNGDGYSDLAVGAPGDDSFNPDAGRVKVYFGGRTAVVDSEVDGLVGGYHELAMDGRAGATIRSAGDVNGDGCADLIWAIPGRPPSDIGHAYLFTGAPGSSFDGVTDTELSSGQTLDGYGSSAGGIGDVNGDGFDDLYVASIGKINIYHGEPGSRIDAVADRVLAIADTFAVVGGAGDINGDGAADVIFGDYQASLDGNFSGAAYLYIGRMDEGIEPAVYATLNGRGFQDRFGIAVASAGDVNGDGYSDVLVANLRDDDFGGGQAGSVDLFLGSKEPSNQKPYMTVSGTIGNDFFGANLLGAGDVNGDGYDDVLVGAPQTDLNREDKVNTGKAYLYLGGRERGISAAADATFEGAMEHSFLGRKTAGGDFDGDGASDIAIASPGHNNDAGKVEIFLGGIQLDFDNEADAVLLGAPRDSFGEGLAR